MLFPDDTSPAVPVEDDEDDVEDEVGVPESEDAKEVMSTTEVDPPAELGVCVIVEIIGDCEDCDVGVCEVDEGADEVLEVKCVEDEDEKVEVLVGVKDELVRGRLEEEKVEESGVEAEGGLLLALELDGIESELEELDGTAGVDVEDAASEVGVLVELPWPDMVNCLPKTSFPGCL